MPVYRSIQTTFWQDGFVTELTPEEKYFYFYLLTNGRTTQCGIYEFNKVISEAETGYNRETLEKLIRRFEKYEKILYCQDTKEIFLLNWMKYNYINSKNTMKCINKELKKVKSKSFINILYKKCVQIKCDLEMIFKDIVVAMEADPPCAEEVKKVKEDEMEADLPCQEKIKKVKKDEIERDLEGASKPLGEKEKEIQKKEEEEIKPSSSCENAEKLSPFEEKAGSRALIEFNRKIHEACIPDMEMIGIWRGTFEEDLIIEAIHEAVKYKKRSTPYINAVLKSWKAQGITTMEKFNEYRGKEKEEDKINVNAYKYLD